MGYVFQDGRLFPHLSVADNIRFGMRYARKKPGEDEQVQVIDLLGLNPLLDRYPRDLSGGEKAARGAGARATERSADAAAG